MEGSDGQRLCWQLKNGCADWEVGEEPPPQVPCWWFWGSEVGLLLWEWGTGIESHGLGPGAEGTPSGRSGCEGWLVCTRGGQEREAVVGYHGYSSRAPPPATLPAPPLPPPRGTGTERARHETLCQILCLFWSRLRARLGRPICFPVAQTPAGHMARRGQAWNEGPTVSKPSGYHVGWFPPAVICSFLVAGGWKGGDISGWTSSLLVWTPTIWLNFLRTWLSGSRTWWYIEIACVSLAVSDVIGLGCDLCSGNV